MPKLLLITASSPEIRRVRRTRVLNFQQITMAYLAAQVPSGWQIQHVDEEAEPLNWNSDADVVAITFHTPSAYHAYAIADHFRSRGKTVALGGPHATLLPEEAAEHADSVFIGEAEGLWSKFLRSCEHGKPDQFYRQNEHVSLEAFPLASKKFYHRHDYTNGVLFATRGCPNRCDFCTIKCMYPHGLQKRPVDQVAAEYASFKGKVIIFWDDNIAADLAYAKELFRAIAPYHKWWSSQASIQAGQDEEFLVLAARSGCKQLFIGLESVSQASMLEVHKAFNRVSEYARIISNIHRHGIAVQAGVVFGFDHDGKDIFRETLDFLETVGIQNATFNILTPFPGTPLFTRLEAEGRILSRDWRQYNSRTDVVFQPLRMSPQELLDGFRYANHRFYSPSSILHRLSRSSVQLCWTLPLNLAYSFRWNFL